MKWIYKKVFQIIIASELISVLFVKILLKRLSSLNLIHLILVLSLFIVMITFFIIMECII